MVIIPNSANLTTESLRSQRKALFSNYFYFDDYSTINFVIAVVIAKVQKSVIPAGFWPESSL